MNFWQMTFPCYKSSATPLKITCILTLTPACTLKAGKAWQNQYDLVFTNELDGHLAIHTVYNRFKKIAASIGIPEARFHDLCHTYATHALSNGDDIKTVQSNLGHATASFTLDVYAHASDKMKQESADRMDKFITEVRKQE